MMHIMTTRISSTAGPLRRHQGPQGRASVSLLVVVLLVGVMVAGLVAWLAGSGKTGGVKSQPQDTLSDPTRAVLGRLQSNVTVRFYAVLDPATMTPALTEFTGRVHHLLTRFEHVASNKLQVTRLTARTDAQAASADGIRPFNIEKGDACFLGLTVLQGAARETLPQLSPDWEAALEYDLSRAIERVASARVAAPAAAPSSDPAIVQSLKALLPNPAAVSLEEGQRVLREKALAALAAASQSMEAQVKAAEDRVAQARASNDDQAFQAAVKELIQLKSEQTEKLKQEAARLQAQLDAWAALKTSSRP